MSTSSERWYSSAADILKELRKVDTSCLCDADKTILSETESINYDGLKLMEGLKARNNVDDGGLVMAGIARTVQLDASNDFLAVIRGLDESYPDDVLVVNTRNSTQAVAGELFCAEGERRGLAGILVEGPSRDVAHLCKYKAIRFYSRSLSPYSGKIQNPGTMQEPVECGGVLVRPGDIVVGDIDGIVVGSADTFRRLLPVALTIQGVEEKIRDGIASGKALASMTNYEEHLQKRLKGTKSALEFRF